MQMMKEISLFDPAIVKSVQEADRIYILAAGTSYNAGLRQKLCLKN